MTRFVKFLSLIWALLALTSDLKAAAHQEAAKPNILFLFADDLAFDAIHSLGNSRIETPNIDRLVASGTTFTHTYNQGGWNGAVCVASRAMLITGRFLWDAQADHSKINSEYRENDRLWPQLMSQAGYSTFFTGKWHIPTNANQVFDHATHIRGGMPNQTPEGYNRPIDGEEDPWDPTDPKFGGFWKGGKHWSEVVADDTEEFLKTSAELEKPFFMYIAFNAPHDPRQAPQEFQDRYPPESIPLPENFLPEYPYEIGSNKIRDERLAPFPRSRHAVQVNRSEYYAIITHMDEQIGRILDRLEATGQTENTYIFFTADHGLSVGHHGLMGKQNMYDHSVRVPFVAVGPQFEAGAEIGSPIYLQDIMPTTLELAGIEKPDTVDFKSLLPLVSDDRQRNYDSIYSAYVGFQRMVVKDGFKLIYYPKIDRSRLFDLSNDPSEMNDLLADGGRGPNAVAKNLAQELKAWGSRLGDDLDYSTWRLLR